MTTTIERLIDSAPAAPVELPILRGENRFATVKVFGTYEHILGVVEPVVTKLRVVGRRKDGTGSTYTVRLPACLRDECRMGHLIACDKPNNHITAVNAWLRHIKTHCHGWHEAGLRRFVGDVLATYGGPFKAPTVGVAASKYRPSQYAVPPVEAVSAS